MSEVNTPRLSAEVIWRETDDGVVIVDPQAGDVRALNGVGSDIWKMVGDNQPLNAIHTQLMDDYGITPEQAQNDVSAFLKQLSERNLITWG